MEKIPGETKGKSNMTEKDIRDLADEAILHINREKGFDVTLAEIIFNKVADEKDTMEVFNKVREIAKRKRPDLFIPSDKKAWRTELNAPQN